MKYVVMWTLYGWGIFADRELRAVFDNPDDAHVTADWLNDRDAGYPSLRKFEGGNEASNRQRPTTAQG